MAKPTHRLLIEDRGSGHIHRYTPSCSCGRWVGVHRRTRGDAAEEHRQHVAAGRSARYGPQPITPVDRLPEILR